MKALLSDLADVLEKHDGGLGYTTADDGVHVYIGSDVPCQKACIEWPTNGNVTYIRKLLKE